MSCTPPTLYLSRCCVVLLRAMTDDPGTDVTKSCYQDKATTEDPVTDSFMQLPSTALGGDPYQSSEDDSLYIVAPGVEKRQNMGYVFLLSRFSDRFLDLRFVRTQNSKMGRILLLFSGEYSWRGMQQGA